MIIRMRSFIFAVVFIAAGTGTALAGNIPQDITGLSLHQVLELYVQAMSERNADPNLSIYTKDTREWKKEWVVTNSQMARSESSIKSCGKGTAIKSDKLAVIRYNLANRECHPFYFVFEDGAWRMDFLTMMQTIRFNHRNLWLLYRKDHPYMFAFKDWIFDKNGFPHD